MSEWIDLCVYAAFLVAVWFVFPNVDWRVALPHLTRRNPELLSRSDVAQRFRSPWSSGFCYVVGIGSIAALVLRQIGLLPAPLTAVLPGESTWHDLYTITAASTLLFIALAVIAAFGLQARVRNDVPLPDSRRASLRTRSLDDYVPRTLRIALVVVIAVHLAAWVAVAVLELYVAADFWVRIVGPFLFHGLGLAYAVWVVKRPPEAADRMLGRASRASEIRFNFAAQLFIVFWGATQLYSSVVESPPFDVDRVLYLGTVLFTLAGGLALYVFGTRYAPPEPSGRTP